MQWARSLPKWLVIDLVVLLTLVNGWLIFLAFRSFQPLITVLAIATLLSFLLDYPLQFVQRKGMQRGYAVLIIVLLVLGIVTIAGVTLVPLLLSQLSDLANHLPVWLESGSQQFETLDAWFDAQSIPLDLSGLVSQLTGLLPEELTVLPNQLLEVVVGAADRVVEAVLTLVLTVYLLLHGKEFWGGILKWLPEPWGDRLQQSLKEQFRNYFVGQAAIASLMVLVLTSVFFLLKIPFWLVFGLGIGATVLIPFGDLLSISIVSLLVSLKSVWLGGEVLAIAIVTDQLIDNAVAPRIFSHLVGLNPIWILIVLLIGAQLGGVLGIVIAVPLAATIKTIVDLAIVPSDTPEIL
ncbi:MAG: AI-2E family transporter [Prochlorotrichaceae cyanobacterium]|jgi:predicted PurR-regulated permease PerM